MKYKNKMTLKNGFNYTEFKNWANSLDITTKDFRIWLKEFLLSQAKETIRRAQQRTPVDTGFLRNAYGLGNQKLNFKIASDGYHIELADNSDIASIDIIGSTLQITIWNLAEYFTYVEYGHRGYDGKYMLTISLDEVQRQLPARFNKEWLKFLRDRGVV